MPPKIVPTIDATQVSGNEPSASIARDISRSRITAAGADASGDLTARFDESTRQLLCRRVRIAAITLISVMVVITAVTTLTGQVPRTALIARGIAAGILVVLVWLLGRRNNVSPVMLQLAAIFVVAAPLVEILLVLVNQTEALVAKGELHNIPTLRAFIALAVSMIITVYGIFIPSNWRRTAFVTGITACMPTAVMLVHGRFNEALQNPVVARPEVMTVLTMFTLIMAAIATLGAHVVHQIRRQVEEARQYGQYRLTTEIGRGGMGVVYRAEHRMLKRPAAIKLIRAESAADEKAIDSFESEVQISATLSHWNTVQIYDYGRTKAGDFYYVMEYLEGETLQTLLAKCGTLDVGATVAIVRQICDGLEEAHGKGLVHRDLKPANTFLADTGGQSGVVKILDFGLAMSVASKTGAGTICGTPLYMSPEQARGKPVDQRSDIYSIGCIVFECLTGAPPFSGPSVTGILGKHLNEPPSFSDFPEGASCLRPIIERCLQKSPDDRFRDVRSLRNAVDVASPTPVD